jgi:hypothetical protein
MPYNLNDAASGAGNGDGTFQMLTHDRPSLAPDAIDCLDHDCDNKLKKFTANGVVTPYRTASTLFQIALKLILIRWSHLESELELMMGIGAGVAARSPAIIPSPVAVGIGGGVSGSIIIGRRSAIAVGIRRGGIIWGGKKAPDSHTDMHASICLAGKAGHSHHRTDKQYCFHCSQYIGCPGQR